MRKKILFWILSAICVLSAAQVPQGLNYQAVLNNAAGAPVASTTIQVSVGILSDTLTPVIVWEELHSTVKTNASGVFNLVIGTGIKQSGSAATFSDVDWTKTPLYIKIQVDYQGSWKSLGSAKLWSVPYAMATEELTGNLKKLAVTGETNDMEEALFEVKNKDGQTVFAVYNEGVRIYVDNGAKGAKGGFAIGGFGTSKTPSQNLLFVDPDSIRTYISTDTEKGAKGGFSIGGFSSAKSGIQDLLIVNADSIRAYIDRDAGKGVKGGFAVGGFESTKTPSQNLLVVNHDSIRAYIDTETAKGIKGGFAIGGFSGTKTLSQDMLFVNADSIRAYIDTNTGKGIKGGFAIGGFSNSKMPAEEYLRVTRDSTRVYLNNTSAKGTKGGFAIGGFGSSKGLPAGYMFIHPDSTRFYVRESGSGNSSTFNIIGIKLDNTLTSLLTASTDTVGIGGVLNVTNNLTVTGNINYTGQVSLIVPEVVTMEPLVITDTSAIIMGEIISDGGKPVITSGIVWSTSPRPTIDLATRTIDGTLSGQFTSTMSELTEYTTYYVRAYATNANGTGYGNEVTFSTVGVVIDIDGNWYIAGVAGTQIWMLQNLKVTHLNDGTPIPNVTDDAAWMSLSTPGYAWYNNDEITYADYGLLYNWATVNTGNLCPAGWHVPSEAEYTTVITWAGGPLVAGGVFKEAGNTHWLDPNTGAANDDYGFALLPGGLRSYMGPFSGIGESGNLWSSTKISIDPAYVSAYYNSAEVFLQTLMEGSGMSIRCVKD
ncbi:MAG: hypothetical protein A2Z69_01670 [Bacteroidetes bacterium RBG_13_44_24]|nr:MAG: hypothetical protein A2Z69_01670 [Bacteroidetes bacterium RBG_13_44_24]